MEEEHLVRLRFAAQQLYWCRYYLSIDKTLKADQYARTAEQLLQGLLEDFEE